MVSEIIRKEHNNCIETKDAKVDCSDLEKKNSGEAHLTEQARRPDETNDTEMGFSLFLYPLPPPPTPHSLPPISPISGVNVTFLDAFHSLFTVPAWRRSVKPIYIWKWPFFLPFSFFFLSSLPSLTSSAHHSPLFIFVRECIWQGGRPAFISQDISACISESGEIYYILVRMDTRGRNQLPASQSGGTAGCLRCCDAALT